MEVIFQTVMQLAAILLALAFIAIALIQYLKEKWGLAGRLAEIVSLVIGFCLSALVALVYASEALYKLSIAQWVAVLLFVIIGTIAPSGGYKTLGQLAGTRNIGDGPSA